MSYQPPFTLTDRKKNIQASLEIEQNTLSIEQVSAVIEGKAVLGPPREIQEVKNVLAQSDGVNEGVNDVVNTKLDAFDHKILDYCCETPYITQEQL